MMHDIHELYSLENNPVRTRKEVLMTLAEVKRRGLSFKRDYELPYAMKMCYKTNSSGCLVFEYIDNGEIKKGYLFGEKTWFDTEEERAAYRAQYHKERNEKIKRKKLLSEIMARYEEMSTEELEAIVNAMK